MAQNGKQKNQTLRMKQVNIYTEHILFVKFDTSTKKPHGGELSHIISRPPITRSLNKKTTLPGDSIRELFICDRWNFTYPLKVTFCIPKKVTKNRVSTCLFDLNLPLLLLVF